MEFEDFRKEALKACGKHYFKISNSNGLRQSYRWIKKNKWLNIGQPLSEREFSTIVKTMNHALQDRVINGKDALLPCGMGKLELRKTNCTVEFRDGKIKTNLPIDWKRTLELWWQDEESKEKKKLVRREIKEIFNVYYNKQGATYRNKVFYKFIPHRAFKLRLKQEILDNNVDAFLLKRKNELYKCKADNG